MRDPRQECVQSATVAFRCQGNPEHAKAVQDLKYRRVLGPSLVGSSRTDGDEDKEEQAHRRRVGPPACGVELNGGWRGRHSARLLNTPDLSREPRMGTPGHRPCVVGVGFADDEKFSVRQM